MPGDAGLVCGCIAATKQEHARNIANGYRPDVAPNVLGDAGLRCLEVRDGKLYYAVATSQLVFIYWRVACGDYVVRGIDNRNICTGWLRAETTTILSP